MDILSLAIELIVLCVVLAILYVIVKAIMDYTGAPWSALALKVFGLICLLVVAVWLLSAIGGVIRIPKVR